MGSGGQAQSLALFAGRAACRALIGTCPGTTTSAPRASTLYLQQHGSALCTASSPGRRDGELASSSTAADSSTQLPAQASAWSWLEAEYTPTVLGRRGSSWQLATATPSTPASASAPWSLLRTLHTSAKAQHAASTEGPESSRGIGGGAGEPPKEEQPVTNPLQAALAAAAASSSGAYAGSATTSSDGVEGLSQASRAAGGRQRQPRTWMWYDEADEREERRKELAGSQFADGGSAHLMDVPQSLKKMNRIMRLIRGLPYADAVAQCTLVPHKASKYVLQALEAAHEDATEVKGLDPERLVVGTIFVTKGMTAKGMQPHGKGGSGSMHTRKSHLRVVLTEAAGRPAAFARVVAPMMGRPMLGAALRGAGAQQPQRRFAFRMEV